MGVGNGRVWSDAEHFPLGKEHFSRQLRVGVGGGAGELWDPTRSEHWRTREPGPDQARLAVLVAQYAAISFPTNPEYSAALHSVLRGLSE